RWRRAHGAQQSVAGEPFQGGAMSQPEHPDPPDPLAVEWERLDLLGGLLADSRQGRAAPAPRLGELRRLQGVIASARADGSPLAALAGEPLTGLELDVLAAAVAPEAEPRLGWMFQSLQTGALQPYPTPALLQELLALDAPLARQL